MDQQIGPYRIEGEVGRGGMGVVYRAVDTRLDRTVAIKSLPEDLADDPGRLARFEREAKTLASLNHPNLGGIYGIEDHKGGKYLILEFVEGETLGERLDRGGMPIDDVLEFAGQIAAGLEAAHDAGVVHRDLKPANVKITPDDKIKVLDFGLAKSTDALTSGINVSRSPTVSRQIEHSPTIPGAILGTAPYMSPEQARGRNVDRRTDIWSFGVPLYEMLVGVGPFVGETATDSIGAILHKDVEFHRLPARTPAGVRRLLQRCLNRDKTQRLQSIGDARIELAEAARLFESGQIEEHAIAARVKRGWLWPSVAGIAVVGLIAAAWTHPVFSPPKEKDRKLEPMVVRIDQLTDDPAEEIDLDLSPDGRSLAFTMRDGEDTDIFVQRVGGSKPVNLTADSTADDSQPEFSPDGDRIAFASTREGGGIFIMGATGESPVRVSDTGFDPTWSPDGTMLVYTTERVLDAYGRNSTAQLWAVDIESRERTMISAGDAVGARFSPDGRWIAYWAATNGQRDIWVIPSGGGDPAAITEDVHTDWSPMFSPDAETLYFISDRSGRPNIWRIGFDPESGQAVGAPRPVTSGVAWIKDADISADGSQLICQVVEFSGGVVRVGFDPQAGRTVGEPEKIYDSSAPIVQIDVDQTGRRLVARTFPPHEDIVVIDIDGAGRRRLMDDVYRDRGPVWTPDGEHILFYSNRSGPYQIWVMRPNGTEMRPLVEHPDHDLITFSISNDGKTLAIVSIFNRDPEREILTSGGVSHATVLVELDRPIGEIDSPIRAGDERITNFVAQRFSNDDKHIAGITWSAEGTELIAILDVESREVTPVRTRDGRTIELAAGIDEISWVGADRLLYWDVKRNGAFIWDKNTREVLPVDGLHISEEIIVSHDGRSLFIRQGQHSVDIWMLTLGDEPE